MARMPDRLIDGSTSNPGIDTLLHALERGPDADAQLFEPGQEWLLGTFIPPFQRPVVWEEARMVRFVESAWLGVHLGVYVVNNAMDAPMTKLPDGGERFHPTDRWLVDGQQRLTALHCYFNDAFPVFGARWSEVDKVDRRRFGRREFARVTTRIYNEDDLRVLYDRLNFGGVAHEQSQRALPEGEDEGWRPSSIWGQPR